MFAGMIIELEEMEDTTQPQTSDIEITNDILFSSHSKANVKII